MRGMYLVSFLVGLRTYQHPCNIDFGAQEYDAFLLDVGDKSGVVVNVYVTNFLWEDVCSYVRQREI
jgi:hypothetical protein